MFFKKQKFNPIDLSDDLFGAKSDADRGFVGINLSPLKLIITIVFLYSILGLLFLRTAYLQVFRGEEYRSIAEGNRSKIQYVHPRRGLIYDRNNDPLVLNQPDFSIYINPLLLPSNAQARGKRISEIGDLIGENSGEINEKVSKFVGTATPAIVIKEHIDYEQALKYDLTFSSFPELHVASLSYRKYIDSSLSHILGYMGKINEVELDRYSRSDYLFNDDIGKSGLELKYESQLRGDFGIIESEIDAVGREKRVIYEKTPEPGNDLVLSLDLKFQHQVQSMTEQYLKKIGKSKGVVIVMDPKDNSLLSLVSLPGFDNNLFAQGITVTKYKELIEDKNHPLFNRAINGEYPSGSTIKMIVGAAALEEGVVTENTSFLSSGGLWVANRWFFPDWKAGGHGTTNIYKAIADSVNTYFYTIGGGFGDFNGLGVDRMAKYYNLFGLGRPLGIDLPSEASGLVPTPQWKLSAKNEEWYIGDTYHMAIGQGDVLVTPLQVAAYTSYFANGGKIIEPHLVKKIVQSDGKAHDVEEKIISQDIIDSYNLKVMRAALRRGVTDGSARYLDAYNFTSAGKTGTAQFADNKQPHAWFTGIAPYDKPEIVVTVLIEEGGEGSATAVPLAAEIMSLYFSNLSR